MATKKEAVTAAILEYIAHKKRQEISGLFGRIDFDKEYDYKKARPRFSKNHINLFRGMFNGSGLTRELLEERAKERARR